MRKQNIKRIASLVTAAMLLSPVAASAASNNMTDTEKSMIASTAWINSPTMTRMVAEHSTLKDIKINTITTPVKISATFTRLQFMWDTVPDVDGYEIYKYSSEKNNYVLIDTITENTDEKYTFKDSNLKEDTTYKYKIRTYKNFGQLVEPVYGDYSSPIVIKTKYDSQKNINAIISVAKSKLGCPYVWSAAGPNAFDCSGFVWWVFHNSGAEIKQGFVRNSCQGMYGELNHYCVSYNLSDAKAGDIILFGNGGHYFHTGISLGDGMMIHAGSSSASICIAPASNISCSGVAILRLCK